jgi:hypothetical protein
VQHKHEGARKHPYATATNGESGRFVETCVRNSEPTRRPRRARSYADAFLPCLSPVLFHSLQFYFATWNASVFGTRAGSSAAGNAIPELSRSVATSGAVTTSKPSFV